MRKTLRKTIVALGILTIASIFIALTVILLIIAQGGRLTREGIEKTGILRLHIEPNVNVKVSLDGEQKKLNSDRVEDIQAGEYELRVEAEGYSLWEKEVKIEEGIVSEIFITLFPEKLELEQVTKTQVDRAFFSPSGDYVVYTVTKSKTDTNGIWKLKLTSSPLGIIQNEPERIVNLDIIEDDLTGNYSITISPDNSKFLLTSDSSQKIFFMNDENQSLDLTDIINLGFRADRLEWFESGDSLIVLKGNDIYEFEIDTKATRLIYAFPEEPKFSVNGRAVVFFTQGKYYSYGESTRIPLKYSEKIRLPEADQIAVAPDDSKLLFIKSEDTFYFANLDKSIHTIGKDLSLMSVSPQGNAAIFMNSKGEVFLFRQEYIAAKDSISTSFTSINKQFNKEVESYSWTTNSSHIIYKSTNDQNEPVIFMIDSYGKNIYSILNSNQIKTNDFAVVNNSSQFMILLSDTKEVQEEETPDTNEQTSNLYVIELRN